MRFFPIIFAFVIILNPAFAQTPESMPVETQPAAQAVVRFILTNAGIDVGGKGTYALYPVGERKKELGYAYSGVEARVPVGTYDVRFVYRDGVVRKEAWMEKKRIEGVVEELFEMDVKSTQVRFTLTNLGQPTGPLGRYALFPAGQRDQELVDLPSGEPTTVAAGIYDVRLRFQDGTVRSEVWIARQGFEWVVDRTVELNVVVADLVVNVTRLGQPSQIARCGAYAPGNRTQPIAKGKSGDVLKLSEGVYDVGCVYDDGGVSVEKWLPNEAVTGRKELAVAFDFDRAALLPPESRPAETLPSLPETLAASRGRASTASEGLPTALADAREGSQPETQPQTQPSPPAETQPAPRPPEPKGLPVPPSLGGGISVPPSSWHKRFGCSLIRE